MSLLSRSREIQSRIQEDLRDHYISISPNPNDPNSMIGMSPNMIMPEIAINDDDTATIYVRGSSPGVRSVDIRDDKTLFGITSVDTAGKTEHVTLVEGGNPVVPQSVPEISMRRIAGQKP